MPTGPGSLRLFEFAGIQVFLHWSWFLVAIIQINARSNTYSWWPWMAVEYVMLFAIVTLHEFGHALACRQVGGRADRIVLWPLGGVAIVDPPSRPGAHLWSIAAGPLVNLALLPVFVLLTLVSAVLGVNEAAPNLHTLLSAGIFINLLLFLFNMLPIYPLDGGQILRSLLWYVIGRARSLMAASLVGLIGVAALGLFAFAAGALWIGILAVFAGLQCVSGLALSTIMMRLARAPRRKEYACPSCNAPAPQGAFWFCGSCHRAFDAFGSGRWASRSFGQTKALGLDLSVETVPQPAGEVRNEARCSNCGALARDLKCPDCSAINDYELWKGEPGRETPVDYPSSSSA